MLDWGIRQLDLHGCNSFQARLSINAALRRCNSSVYRLRLIHGYHDGSILRQLIWQEYPDHPRVLRLVRVGPGVTDLVLREL